MKVLVVDDHALIREALRGVLSELRTDVVVQEACNSQQAMRRIEQDPALELVLLDLNLPDADGFEVLAALRDGYVGLSVVVLSGQSDRESVQRALDLGALGFIPKSAPREVMLTAFNLIFAGGIYIPPEILGGPKSVMKVASGKVEREKPVLPSGLGLTERQIDVLALMMRGKSNKAICRDLDLAEQTVKTHVSAILKTLKATNRTEAVIAAGALGFGPPAAN